MPNNTGKNTGYMKIAKWLLGILVPAIFISICFIILIVSRTEKTSDVHLNLKNFTLDVNYIKPNSYYRNTNLSPPNRGDHLITEDEVKNLLKKFGYEEVDDETAKSATDSLLYYNIVTATQFNTLLHNTQIIDSLSEIYRKTLGRTGAKVLDPEGLCTWGAYLYFNGITTDSIRAIKDTIAHSSEYGEKHPE